ncbi:major facilitator superfamily domain-containing protein [Phascolomyces articulosus]|uniref:Major facilitator superfamily domain-containing protein n=1 Tax=Phascolomyces articulosus TaxID=60185 RepID=A0AAD5PBF9_9FUNG|nr:major facilitator superfamily domain-containing protein [Phascolomyces articulosus]
MSTIEEKHKEKTLGEEQHHISTVVHGHDDGDDDVENPQTIKEKQFFYSKEERKLLKKLVIAVIPLLALTELVQLTDKLTLNLAGVMGIYEDIQLSMTQFSWLGSLYYLGYLCCEVCQKNRECPRDLLTNISLRLQIPNAYLIQQFPLSKYFGSIVIAWGAVLLCTAFGQNFSQLAGLRFFMGFFEGTTSPVCLMLLGLLFRRKEQIILIALLEIASELALVISTLIVYLIGYGMDGLANLRSWKWNMIIFGSLTIIIGTCVFIFLPNNNDSKWLRLSPNEKDLVKERTRDSGLVLDKSFKVRHVYEAIGEPRLYCYFFIIICLFLQNGCMATYSSQIIKEAGFTELNAVLLNIPRGIIAILFTIGAIYTSYRIHDIARIGAIMAVVSFTGVFVLYVVPHGPVRLLGVYLSTIMAPYILVLVSCACNVAGYSKKAFYNACIFIALCLGNFIGPLIMLEREAPRFLTALTVYMAADLTAALLFIYVYWIHRRRNHIRSTIEDQGKLTPPQNNQVQKDMSDQEDISFKFIP